MDVYQLAEVVRSHPGLLAKRDLSAVADTIGGDGDDAAVTPDGTVLCAEAVHPGFAARDPRVAGIAAVVTCLNDVAAAGGRPTGLLDTVVAPSDAVARDALGGIRSAADLYRVPVLGGHTTITPGPLQVSSFATGRAERPLRAAHARPGEAVVFVTTLDGALIEGPDGSCFYSHLRGPRAQCAADDLALVADAAEAGEAWAARDVSMPGLVGSLVQFLESAGGLGATLDFDAIPVPGGARLDRWISAFSSYGFLLVGDPARLTTRFHGAGLECAEIARLDGSGRLELRCAGARTVAWDFAVDRLTGLSVSD